MAEAQKTEAQTAAASLIEQYGEPKSRESWLALVALAYSHGALVATSQLAERVSA